MGLPEVALSQVVNRPMVIILSALIEKYGGVQSIVKQMAQHGLGKTVKSWVS
jgi:uncharacterized protein YidB (DUF937 family)